MSTNKNQVTTHNLQNQPYTEAQQYDIANMAFRGTLRDSQWATPGFEGSQQAVTSSFNPALANFQPQSYQPSGMDMTLYQEPRSIPTQDSQNLQKQIVDLKAAQMGAKHNAEYHMMVLEQTIQETARNNAGLREMVQKDLQTLQQKIEELKTVDPEIDDFGKHYTHNSAAIPEDLFQNKSDEEIAEAYIGLAKQKEAFAARCRKAAKAFAPGGQEVAAEQAAEDSEVQVQLEMPPGPGDKVICFACCGTAFGTLDEMLDHCRDAHASATAISIVKKVEGKEAILETSVARESSRPRPHAIDIKAPEAVKTEAEALQEATEATAQKQDVAAASTKTWIPHGVRVMPSLPSGVPASTETFSWDHIKGVLGGEEWCDAFYFISDKHSKLKSRAYWLLDEDFEPYLPKNPGQHGAKLTPFFNNTLSARGKAPTPDNYMNCPVFIRAKGEAEYRYFGQYSQERYSDRVDYDHLMDEIPDHVRLHWASKLAEVGRPDWVTRELMLHYFDRPKYDGDVPTDSAVNTPKTTATIDNSADAGLERRVLRDLEIYAEELKVWEKDAKLKATLLTADSIYKSFSVADTDEQPGLRLNWEYMQCIGYDAGFENMLVKLKDPRLQAPHSATAKSERTVKIGDMQVSEAVARQANSIAADKKKRAAEKKAKEEEQAARDAAKPTVFKKTEFEAPAPKKPAPSSAPKPAPAASASKGKAKENQFGMGDLNATAKINETNQKSLPPHRRGGAAGAPRGRK